MPEATPPTADQSNPRLYLSAGIGLFVVALLVAVTGSWLIVRAGQP